MTYARAAGGRKATPQQGPPSLSSQEEYPPLVRKMEHPISRGAIELTQPSPQRGSKSPQSSSPPGDGGTVVKPGDSGADSRKTSPLSSSPPGDGGTVVKPGGDGADSGKISPLSSSPPGDGGAVIKPGGNGADSKKTSPLSSSLLGDGGAVIKPGSNGADSRKTSPEPMNQLTLKRRALPDPPQQLYPAPGPMRSGALVPFSQTPKKGSRELEGSPLGAQWKGKAPRYASRDGSDRESALIHKAVPFLQEPRHALIGHSHHATSWLSISPERESQNQLVHLPHHHNQMASLPVTIAPHSDPDSGSLSLPNTPTADMNGRDFAIYQNTVLVAVAQKEHEEKMRGLYGQDLSVSSTNPDGHYVCGRVLEDMKIRNAELKEEIQAIKAKEEELSDDNNAIKDRCSAMEATLLSIGSQKTISLSDFTKMMEEMTHLRAIAEHTEPMVETVNGYQQEIAVLRARLLANGLDPSIIAAPVVLAPQEPISALPASIQETPASGSLVAVSNSVNSEQENGRFPSNKFFVGEFGIFFRSIANLGRCNYQFTRQMPVTTVQIPPQVREKLKVIVQGDESLLDWLLDDANKTKFLLVSGLFARLIYNEIMVEAFVDQLILKMGEAPSEKDKILSGWVQSKFFLPFRQYTWLANGEKKDNPDITNKVWPILTEVSENLGAHLHNKYVSLLSRPTDARHLEESLRSLVGCIEHAGRLALGMAYLGWGNWRFMFHGTACPFQSAKMTVCDLGTEGLLNFGHDTSVLEERGAKIKFCVFPMIYRRDNTGTWKVLVKATVLV